MTDLRPGAHTSNPSLRMRLRLIAVIVLGLLLVATSCRVNQFELAAADKLSPSANLAAASSVFNVAYGPGSSQRMDVLRPSTAAKGTLLYLHSGGWTSGDKASVAAFIAAELARGWAIVSVNYGLAPDADLAEMVSDTDRAVRYVRRHAGELGLDVSTLIVTGTSAGGTIALLQSAENGFYVDRTLPADLAEVSSRPDAVVSLVGPTDLGALWAVGGLGPSSVEAVLGCTPRPDPSNPTLRVCSDAEVQLASPTFWAAVDVWLGVKLPPAYLGYGQLDGLVTVPKQGDPLAASWEAAAGYLSTYYDVPPTAGHNLDFDLNKTAFDLWLDMVVTRRL